MKIWIVVTIDHYNGDMNDCFCTQSDYAGLKVCRTESERDEEVARIEAMYAHSARVEEVDLE